VKIRVERDVLAEAVAWAARSLPARPPAPVLAGLLLKAEEGALSLSSFDYEVSARVSVDAEVDEEGTVLVSGRLLADICRALPNRPVEISTDGVRATVVCGSSRFTLHTLPVEEYPALPQMPTATGTVPGEVFASSNDRPYEEHLRVAQSLMTKAVAEANAGQDVVILLDSLTRLARVHNAGAVGNRTLSGGLDSRAMEIPRRFFGMARNIEEGGSLTILATILVGTGSRMDDVIFQEFKGTGNMELVLSRPAAEQRIFPAINIAASGTRKEELLIDPKDLPRVYKLRKALAGIDEIQAASLMVEFLKRYPTNAQALASLD